MRKNKKKILLIIIIIGIMLISVGVGFSTLRNKYVKEKNQEAEKNKTLRKIYEEEINQDTTNEIIEFYLEEVAAEKQEVKSAKLIASDENGEYLVRIQLESEPDNLKQTTMYYLGDGKWKVTLPLEASSTYSDKYTMFWPEESDCE